MSETATVGDVLQGALEAYEALTSLAEDVEEEWTYVTDLSAAWTERLEDVVVARGAEPAGELAQAAIERLMDEVGRIQDPHRAIDWLSTFPHIALTALGEQP